MSTAGAQCPACGAQFLSPAQPPPQIASTARQMRQRLPRWGLTCATLRWLCATCCPHCPMGVCYWVWAVQAQAPHRWGCLYSWAPNAAAPSPAQRGCLVSPQALPAHAVSRTRVWAAATGGAVLEDPSAPALPPLKVYVAARSLLADAQQRARVRAFLLSEPPLKRAAGACRVGSWE